MAKPKPTKSEREEYDRQQRRLKQRAEGPESFKYYGYGEPGAAESTPLDELHGQAQKKKREARKQC